jgi:hypothetical protein
MIILHDISYPIMRQPIFKGVGLKDGLVLGENRQTKEHYDSQVHDTTQWFRMIH